MCFRCSSVARPSIDEEQVDAASRPSVLGVQLDAMSRSVVRCRTRFIAEHQSIALRLWHLCDVLGGSCACSTSVSSSAEMIARLPIAGCADA